MKRKQLEMDLYCFRITKLCAKKHGKVHAKIETVFAFNYEMIFSYYLN